MNAKFSLPNLLMKKQQKELEGRHIQLINEIDKIFRTQEVTVGEALTVFDALAAAYKTHAIKSTKLIYDETNPPSK